MVSSSSGANDLKSITSASIPSFESSSAAFKTSYSGLEYVIIVTSEPFLLISALPRGM